MLNVVLQREIQLEVIVLNPMILSCGGTFLGNKLSAADVWRKNKAERHDFIVEQKGRGSDG